jgi:hypothetical protein
MLILNKYHKPLHFTLPSGTMFSIDSKEIKEISKADFDVISSNKFIYKTEVQLKPKQTKQITN